MITAGKVVQMEDSKGFPVAVKRWSNKNGKREKNKRIH